jgi:hypothetical protein
VQIAPPGQEGWREAPGWWVYRLQISVKSSVTTKEGFRIQSGVGTRSGIIALNHHPGASRHPSWPGGAIARIFQVDNFAFGIARKLQIEETLNMLGL